MLKYDKIQVEMLKDTYKGKKWDCSIDEETGDVYVMHPKRTCIYVIPKCFWFLNNKAFNCNMPVKNVCDKLQKNICEYETAYPTSISKESKCDKKITTVIELRADKGNRVWVNKEFLKYFENTIFKIKGPKDIICVFDARLFQFIGCILPVYVKEDE